VNWHISEAAGVHVWPNVSPTQDQLVSGQASKDEVPTKLSYNELGVTVSYVSK